MACSCGKNKKKTTGAQQTGKPLPNSTSPKAPTIRRVIKRPAR